MISEGCFQEWEAEILQYLDGELGESDRLRVERHVQTCRRCRAFLADMGPIERSIDQHFRATASENPLPEDFIQKVMSSLPSMISLPWHWKIRLAIREFSSREGLKRLIGQHPVTAGALVLFVIGTLSSIWLNHLEYDYRVKINAWGNKTFDVSLSQSVICENPNGQMYELPDGSLIFAQPGAVFSVEAYQKHGDDRWVRLRRGEVWLDVRGDVREGFTVTTPEARLKVTGTCFAVKLEPDVSTVEVARGNVLVENVGRGHPKSCYLKPKKKISANRGGRLVEFGDVNSDRIGSIEGQFPKTPSKQ